MIINEAFKTKLLEKYATMLEAKQLKDSHLKPMLLKTTDFFLGEKYAFV